MKFQVCYLPGEMSETIRLAQLCEDLGYDALWLPDQTFHRDPFPALAAIAQVTQHIKIGVGVTTPFARHPVQIARAIASVDELSAGRSLLGLGAGNKKMYLDKLGLSQKRAAARVREAADAIRKLLAGESVSMETPDLTMHDVQLEFSARDDLPIYVASRAPLMLAVGGEVADGVIAESLFTTGAIQYFLERVRHGAETAGRETEHIESVCWQVVDVVEDRDRGVEALRMWTAHIVGASNDEVAGRMGIEPEVHSAIQAAYRKDGQKAAAEYVTEREVDAVAIVGDASHCAEKVHAIAAEGVSAITLLVRGTAEDKERTLSQFSAKVIPELEAALA